MMTEKDTMENNFKNPLDDVIEGVDVVDSMRETINVMIHVIERHELEIKELQWKLKEKDNER